jgi:hypothetical protein
MVEALDRMVTDGLTAEVKAIAAEKQAIAEDRVKFHGKMKESATQFNNFMVTKLAEEIGELRRDRKQHNEGLEKLENFVVHALAREIQEFAQDKQAVVEAKVKLVAEGRKQLTALKSRFVTESASRLNTVVTTHLKGEMSQLKEDIMTARENDFGRRIFESFASEFSATHLNEKADTRKLMQALTQKEQQLAESTQKVAEAKKLVESKEREVRIIKESNSRQKTMEELLSTLNEQKAVVMRDLLESVQTPRLQAAFDKYLPSVLNTITEKKETKKSMLSESVKEVTGNKSATKQVEAEDRNNVIDLRRLAGL